MFHARARGEADAASAVSDGHLLAIVVAVSGGDTTSETRCPADAHEPALMRQTRRRVEADAAEAPSIKKAFIDASMPTSHQ